MGGLVTESVCKIRERGCSSSSSSSSVLKNGRPKRTFLVGRRRASTTPVPTWKMSPSPSSMAFQELPLSQNLAQKGKQGHVSARKLAAILWETIEIPRPQQLRKEDAPFGIKSRKSSLSSRDRMSSGRPAPSHSVVSENMDLSALDSSSIRNRISSVSQRYKYQVLGSSRNSSVMEVEVRSKGITPMGSLVSAKSITDRCHSSNFEELLKILDRIWGLEDENLKSKSLVSAMRGELKKAHLQINRLIEEHKSDRREIEHMVKRMTEEKETWRKREKRMIRAAMRVMGDKLEMERKWRRTESMNKMLGRDLAETRRLLAKATEELERERKTNQMMEKVCDELSQGIREDKAEVEELKRESAKVWEEVEREREMLQLADVWREERVQMKLADAKFQLEEKNAALDKLGYKLESLLKMEKTGNKESEEVPGALFRGENQEESDHRNQTRKDTDRDLDEDSSSSSPESCDLHSIELCGDRTSRSYKWNYASVDTTLDDLHEQNPTSISFGAGNGAKLTEWDVCSSEDNCQENNGVTDQRRFCESRDVAFFYDANRHSLKQDDDDDLEMQTYEYVKGLRDQVMAGSKVVPMSPTQNSNPLELCPEKEDVCLVKDQT